MSDGSPPPPDAEELSGDWIVLTHPTSRVRLGAAPGHRGVVGRMVAAAAAVSLLIGTIAFFVSNRLAEQDTLAEGLRITDILASEVTSALNDDLYEERPDAIATLDRGVLPAMNRYGIRRVKVFDEHGTVLYSDEHRLIGQTFDLGELEKSALESGRPQASVSTPEGAENQYEKVPGMLIEVRQLLQAGDGQHALLEVYLDYAIVGQRANQMWRAFVVLLAGSLVLLTAMVIPVALQLLRRISDGNRQREQLLRRTVEASDLERRRIAGSLHDGPVQELVGYTLVLTTMADQLDRQQQEAAAASVRDAAAATRRTVGSLRTLLVDLYPATLEEQGLSAALRDLLGPLATRGLSTTLTLDGPDLSVSDQRLVYRIAEECLRNSARHSGATAVGVRLEGDAAAWRLVISDNGRGFDAAKLLSEPETGHFGLRIISDLAADADAGLRVASGPDGTTWELTKDVS